MPPTMSLTVGTPELDPDPEPLVELEQAVRPAPSARAPASEVVRVRLNMADTFPSSGSSVRVSGRSASGTDQA